MKIRRLLLTLTVAAMGLQHVSAQTADHFSTKAAVRSLADADDDSYNRYASTHYSGINPADKEILAPTASTFAPEQLSQYGGFCGCADSSGCAGGQCGPGSGKFGGGRFLGRSLGWFTAETLLFFAADRSSPPLAVVAGDGVNPLEGDVTFGGTLSSGLLPGYRVSAGLYLDPQQRIGVGARAFGNYSNTNSYSIASDDGTTSIGVPFFNPLLFPNPGNDAFIVAGNTPGGDPISVGSLQAGESFAMFGAEASGYLLLARGNNYRFDLVAGYTYNQLRNSINHSMESTNLFDGDGIVNGTVFETQDRFATDNRFSGAHLGVLSNVVRNRVSLSTLSKVSFGNMRNRTSISGSGVTTVPGDPPFEGDGFFARASNIGTLSADRFAFLPELGVKLGYAFRPNLELTVGYTLLMWSSVALAGEQIDPVIDQSGISGRPAPSNRTSAYWMQSIDLGLGWSY